MIFFFQTIRILLISRVFFCFKQSGSFQYHDFFQKIRIPLISWFFLTIKIPSLSWFIFFKQSGSLWAWFFSNHQDPFNIMIFFQKIRIPLISWFFFSNNQDPFNIMIFSNNKDPFNPSLSWCIFFKQSSQDPFKSVIFVFKQSGSL